MQNGNLLARRLPIAVLPLGSDNSLCATLDIWDLFTAVMVMIKGEPLPMDACAVHELTPDMKRGPLLHIMSCALGWGFMGDILQGDFICCMGCVCMCVCVCVCVCLWCIHLPSLCNTYTNTHTHSNTHTPSLRHWKSSMDGADALHLLRCKEIAFSCENIQRFVFQNDFRTHHFFFFLFFFFFFKKKKNNFQYFSSPPPPLGKILYRPKATSNAPCTECESSRCSTCISGAMAAGQPADLNASDEMDEVCVCVCVYMCMCVCVCFLDFAPFQCCNVQLPRSVFCRRRCLRSGNASLTSFPVFLSVFIEAKIWRALTVCCFSEY